MNMRTPWVLQTVYALADWQQTCKLRKATCICCRVTKAISQNALLCGLNAHMAAGSAASSHLQACAVHRGGTGTTGRVLQAITVYYRCALW